MSPTVVRKATAAIRRWGRIVVKDDAFPRRDARIPAPNLRHKGRKREELWEAGSDTRKTCLKRDKR